jgi:hypothetical protein
MRSTGFRNVKHEIICFLHEIAAGIIVQIPFSEKTVWTSHGTGSGLTCPRERLRHHETKPGNLRRMSLLP